MTTEVDGCESGAVELESSWNRVDFAAWWSLVSLSCVLVFLCSFCRMVSLLLLAKENDRPEIYSGR
jgi:hypothetical protein